MVTILPPMESLGICGSTKYCRPSSSFSPPLYWSQDVYSTPLLDGIDASLLPLSVTAPVMSTVTSVCRFRPNAPVSPRSPEPPPAASPDEPQAAAADSNTTVAAAPTSRPDRLI